MRLVALDLQRAHIFFQCGMPFGNGYGLDVKEFEVRTVDVEIYADYARTLTALCLVHWCMSERWSKTSFSLSQRDAGRTRSCFR